MNERIDTMDDQDSAPVTNTNDPTALGKVAAPPNKESTSDLFYFWVRRDSLTERTQIVHTTSSLGGREVAFVGLVEEVYRQSRQRDMSEEVDRFDGSLNGRPPPFASEGFSYAKAVILRTEPVTHAPPTEESTVRLGGREEAAKGYGIDRMREENKLAVGRLRNGGTGFAGPAIIDLAYLLGENGGHLNVNGIAGLGAKSSFLLHANYLLLKYAAEQKKKMGGLPGRLQVAPIIFNVKNFDLFYIDRWNKNWELKRAEAEPEWGELGIKNPAPFQNVKFYAPQEKGGKNPVSIPLRSDVKPYSWGLADIIQQRLLRFLFADEDINDANFGALVGAIEERLTEETKDGPKLRKDCPQIFADFLEWIKDAANHHDLGEPHPGTKGKLTRRLRGLIQDSEGVLRLREQTGEPLKVPEGETEGPMVIDLFGVKDEKLKRFVAAAVFHQLVEKRSKEPVEGLRYIVTLDELNRFAPKHGSDPITEMIERVAAEMRSQGIILLGAQQEASRVSPRVIENSGIRAIGRSGSLELSADVWKFLGPSARSQATQIMENEKLLVQASFRAPMLAKIPFPPWALRKEESATSAVDTQSVSVVRRKEQFAAEKI